MRDVVSVRNNRLVWGLTCGLIVSLLGNFFLTQMFMESQNLNRDLSSAYDELQQSYQELEETYSPKPPVSKDQAIDIALEYGEWNETSLADMEVTANLDYYMYLKRGSESTISFLHNVVAHVPDYAPKEMGTNGWRTTFRYVWVVVVSQREGGKSIPPPGLYHVDASTSDVVFDCDSYHCL